MTAFSLFAQRRFLPLFVVQFLGAFHGNLFKNATIVLILYRLSAGQLAGGKVLATVAVGLFVLPFFLFSSVAGEMADRLDKARVIRATKLFEIAVAVLGVAALEQGTPALLLSTLFLLGCQAALFGPLKYGILPDLLASGELLAANGLVEAGTFLAILAGTLIGSLTVLTNGGVTAVQAMLIGSAVAGWAASTAVPAVAARAPDLPVRWNIAAGTARLLGDLGRTTGLTGTVMGVSWFWLAGATYLTQFPAFAKDVLNAGPPVVSLFLTMFSIGISIGSLACQRLLHGRAALDLAPAGALLMAAFGLDFALSATAITGNDPVGIGTFLASPGSWRLLADLLGISIAAGIYVVPLYTVMQQRAEPAHRARVIAGNNVMNALFMTVAAAAAAALMAGGVGVRSLLAGMAALNLAVAGLTLYQTRRHRRTAP
ncbi:MAG: MFS transporter [Telmatospirillum sp.]|nr:MFS transporter [Telmatospirillum sp.]